jgi:hypothetical protein
MNKLNYVPILKWKAAEMRALEHLRVEQKDLISPVLEIVLPSAKRIKNDTRTPDEKHQSRVDKFINERLPEIPSQIQKSMATRPVYVDFTWLYPTSVKDLALARLIPDSKKLGLNIIPVINLDDDVRYIQDVYKAIAIHDLRLCIKINKIDMQDVAALNEKLNNVVIASVLNRVDIDLIVDTKFIDDDSIHELILKNTQQIDRLQEWGELIFANGSYPTDLTNFKPQNDNHAPRHDWTRWKNYIEQANYTRLPVFSDYTIRHPIYNEETTQLTPSCSIKYTLDDNWYILKGLKYKFFYFIVYAYALANDEDVFYGKEYSYGDEFIFKKSELYEKYMEKHNRGAKTSGSGTSEDWIMSGINHHIAVVLKQLAALPE